MGGDIKIRISDNIRNYNEINIMIIITMKLVHELYIHTHVIFTMK